MKRLSGSDVSKRVLMLAVVAAVASSCNQPAATNQTAGAPDQAAVAAAMAPQPESVSRVFLITVKPGMDARFIEAAKAHVAWHRKMNDPWAFTAFYVETGPDTGQYGWITQGHKWADFDAYDKTITPGDRENVAMTMGPYIEKYTTGMSVALSNFSNPAAPGAVVPLVSVEHFTVHPTKRQDFMVAISRAHGALQKGGFKANYSWSVQVSGNEGLVFNLVLPLSKWADMADDPSFMRIMNEQLGEAGVTAVLGSFNESLVSSRAWIARILPDLSYTPGS